MDGRKALVDILEDNPLIAFTIQEKERMAEYLLQNGCTPVVRCKECEYCYFNDSSLEHYCERRGWTKETVSPDDFCSKGRKIEE